MQDLPVDYSRKWYVMAAVGMGIFLSTIDGSIVNVALPTLVRYYQTEFAVVQWVVLAYLLTVTTLMLSVGRLADMIGKKSIYAAGFMVFTLGSLLCGLAPSVYALIAFRVVQGIGAAMVVSLGMGLVTEAFPPHERGKALGITGAVVSVGIVVGPTLGGIIVKQVSWHWIFFVNLPIGILGTLMVLRFVPAVRPAGGQRFDYTGAALLFLALLSLLLALTFGQNIGFGDPRVLGLFAAFLVFLAAFILSEMRIEQPMVDLSLFRNRLFTVNLVTAFIAFIAVAGTIILIPFYLQVTLGYDPQQAGLLMAALPVALGVMAPISGTLSDRFGSRFIAVIGLSVCVLAYLGMSTFTTQTTTLGFVLRYLPLGLGMGIFQSPNNSDIMGAAPRGRLGIVSGMLAISRTLGQTTGIAVLGALWAARVFAASGSVLPGGATAAAPAAQVAGLHDVFLIMVVILSVALGLAIWALVQTRQARAAGQAQPLAREHKG